MNDTLSQLFSSSVFLLFIKVAFLLFIGFDVIYALFLFTQGQALKKIVFIKAAHGSAVIQIATLIYLILTISLFFGALAIL